MIQYKMTSSAQLKVCSSNNCITNLIGCCYIEGQGTRVTGITGEGTSTLYNVTGSAIINHVNANHYIVG